ncbi:aminopeptidase [Candidatus Kuenenbacteria bacterium]|nr:aminopeptidase [Candidatus Kuenenbacteria bacterium]
MNKVFDAKKLLVDVFNPLKTDVVAFLIDLPHQTCADNEDWQDRRKMALEWHRAMRELALDRGFTVIPPVYFPATGINSGPLPDEIVQILRGCTLGIAMTEFSASGPLANLCKEDEILRVASMPGVLRRMERSALGADYSIVQDRCRLLGKIMQDAVSCRVKFSSSSNHECTFDLRFRDAHEDNGLLHFGKSGIINLPSGEVYKTPYEGENSDEVSETNGYLPVTFNGETVIFEVRENKIVDVTGHMDGVRHFLAFFEADPARRNIAECAFGVNDDAIVTGNVLEDEKAGFHWAYGLSTHLGGTVGPDAFNSPETQVHEDYVYAKESPIQVTSAVLIGKSGAEVVIIEDGEYVIF